MPTKVALLYGGYSGESVISEKSAHEVIVAMKEQPDYIFYPIEVSKNAWLCKWEGEEIAVDKNDLSVMIGGDRVVFDVAFNMIHGAPGEDGKLAGYLEMIGTPYTCSGTLAGALTFNKFVCNNYLRQLGILTPLSLVVTSVEELEAAKDQLQYPVFVKPNNGGSSLATFRIENWEGMTEAVMEALKHDREALIEEFVAGREFSCGVIDNRGKTVALPVTEIIPNAKGFFDYEEKYSQQGANEVTPADIPEELSQEMQAITRHVFEVLQLRSMSRMDYLLKDGKPYLIDVNTVPGFSSRSILPQQAREVGISFSELITLLIETTLQKPKKVGVPN